ncbi:hypothetical protein [Lacihabitans soyangensis]|uniref:hypothetical protein n=1 Tax=Lacihabitans soyangensis TaxID=869394 RepID=UPI0020CD8D04|nr:hypothetical protein [Lacihabitans soyangensis]
MRRIARVLNWKLRVGGSVDSGLKEAMEVFFEELMPGLVVGLMVLVVLVHCLGR